MNIQWYRTPRHRITDKEARRVRELSEQGYLPSAIAWEMPQLTLSQIKHQIYGRKERAPEFYPAYIAAHRGEFYLGWWFGSLSQQERGGLLLSLLEGAFRSLTKKEQLELQKDFCTGSPDFFDYLNREVAR